MLGGAGGTHATSGGNSGTAGIASSGGVINAGGASSVVGGAVKQGGTIVSGGMTSDAGARSGGSLILSVDAQVNPSDAGTAALGGTAGTTGQTGGSSGGTISPPADAKADPSMKGFAAVEKYGLKTTTGGSGGKQITVTTFDELKARAESNEVLIIQISGTITAPGEHGLIKVQSNKTILGLGSNAKLNKVTLSVNGWNQPGDTCEADSRTLFTPASNVVIRNLEFIGLDKFPDDSSVDPDAIRVECYSHHVWIDHNTFQYGADGATDVKRGADLVTLSYNHYVKTQKTALVGHSDNNGAQDNGYLNVTFYQNFFDGTVTRTPRIRFGYAHVYNNYYNISDHVFRIGPGGKIYAEANTVISKEGKILKDTENEGNLTWTTTNVWDKSVYGDIGSEKLDADQSVSKPSYSYSADTAPASPPSAGVGKI
jgi:pectate lyase